MNRTSKTVAFLVSLALPITASAQSSRWKMVEETDRMTDEVSYLAMTQARDSSQFVIQCTKDFIAAYVKVQWIDVALGEDRTIKYRFDQGEIREAIWRNVQRGGGAVIFGDEAVEIAKHAITAKRIVVDNGRTTVEFSLDGAGQALNKLAEKCPNHSLK